VIVQPQRQKDAKIIQNYLQNGFGFIFNAIPTIIKKMAVSSDRNLYRLQSYCLLISTPFFSDGLPNKHSVKWVFMGDWREVVKRSGILGTETEKFETHFIRKFRKLIRTDTF